MGVSYRGTEFCGWQRQSGSGAEGPYGGDSIQGKLEAALAKMTQESPSVVGSGRTDSGVHAVGQCAHFVLKGREWDPSILKNGLNSLVGPRIQIRDVRKVPLDFHAQRSAVKKQYSYYFQQGPCAVAHLEPYSWWIRKTLNVAAMNEALADLKGRHDFRPFQASGAPEGRSTVREILEADVRVEPISFPGEVDAGFHWVRVRLVGTGFLKQMVRGIAGTLLQIGEGRRAVSGIRDILETGARAEVGPTAPARALWLEKVWYPDYFGV